MNISERFWQKVEKTDTCWVWRASKKNRHGHGQFGLSHHGSMRAIPAHRVSWQLTFGVIPNGLYVCHKCDNPSCVRPDHLFLGTQKDNMQDAVAKGRMARGERLGKLTETQIKEIRSLFQTTSLTQKELAEHFEISRANMHRILHRKVWTHI